MMLLDRIKNYRTYRYYLSYLKELRDKGIDLRFSTDEFCILPEIFNSYIDFVTLPSVMEEESFLPDTLDQIVMDNFSYFFTDEQKKVLLGGLRTKNIIPEYPTCTTTTYDNGFYMIMNQYRYLSDVANFMHEILHVFISNTKNPHINSEVMSILFELITRDLIDSFTEDKEYLSCHINTLLDSMLANIKLMEVYPNITPVIIPYVKAEYLSYELFLLYKRDPDKFIYHFRKILASELSIEEYLIDNNIVMGMENFEKIQINHKKILTNR